jgi:hypothetical protein
MALALVASTFAKRARTLADPDPLPPSCTTQPDRGAVDMARMAIDDSPSSCGARACEALHTAAPSSASSTSRGGGNACTEAEWILRTEEALAANRTAASDRTNHGVGGGPIDLTKPWPEARLDAQHDTHYCVSFDFHDERPPDRPDPTEEP